MWGYWTKCLYLYASLIWNLCLFILAALGLLLHVDQSLIRIEPRLPLHWELRAWAYWDQVCPLVPLKEPSSCLHSACHSSGSCPAGTAQSSQIPDADLPQPSTSSLPHSASPPCWAGRGCPQSLLDSLAPAWVHELLSLRVLVSVPRHCRPGTARCQVRGPTLILLLLSGLLPTPVASCRNMSPSPRGPSAGQPRRRKTAPSTGPEGAFRLGPPEVRRQTEEESTWRGVDGDVPSGCPQGRQARASPGLTAPRPCPANRPIRQKSWGASGSEVRGFDPRARGRNACLRRIPASQGPGRGGRGAAAEPPFHAPDLTLEPWHLKDPPAGTTRLALSLLQVQGTPQHPA